ncbi:MAG: hypothetical protein ACP6IP_10010 [Candidatus Njordarchaeia archaeon]
MTPTLIEFLLPIIFSVLISTRIALILGGKVSNRRFLNNYSMLSTLYLSTLVIGLAIPGLFPSVTEYCSSNPIEAIRNKYLDPYLFVQLLLYKLLLPIVLISVSLTVYLSLKLAPLASNLFTSDYVRLDRAKGLSEKTIKKRIVEKLLLAASIKETRAILPYLWIPIIIFEYIYFARGLGVLFIFAYDNSSYILLEITFYIMALILIITSVVLETICKLVSPLETGWEERFEERKVEIFSLGSIMENEYMAPILSILVALLLIAESGMKIIITIEHPEILTFGTTLLAVTIYIYWMKRKRKET